VAGIFCKQGGKASEKERKQGASPLRTREGVIGTLVCFLDEVEKRWGRELRKLILSRMESNGVVKEGEQLLGGIFGKTDLR